MQACSSECQLLTNLRGTHGHPWLDDRLWLWKDYYLVNKLAFDGILR